MSLQPRSPYNGWGRAAQLGTVLSAFIALAVASIAWNRASSADAVQSAEALASVRHDCETQIAGIRTDISSLTTKVDLLLEHFALVPKVGITVRKDGTR